MDRTELIKQAIQKAYNTDNQNITIRHHENGVDTITRFYRKGKAIWCNMVTGCIDSKMRVYDIHNEPYVRDMGRYWTLTGKELEIVKRMASEV